MTLPIKKAGGINVYPGGELSRWRAMWASVSELGDDILEGGLFYPLKKMIWDRIEEDPAALK